MSTACVHNHAIRSSQDRDRYGTCIRCRRISQRRYMAECRDARRRLRQIEALIS